MSINRASILAVLLIGAGATVSGCGTASRTLGLKSGAPDEFRVVAKAPLVVPPDYSLRPPAPGEPRPQELQPESAARVALFGQSAAAGLSEGERLLIEKAGAEKADPLVRYVIDDEFGDLAHKDKSFADTVMFWRKDSPNKADPRLASAAASPAPVDPAVAAAQLKKLTGDQPVIIKRDKGSFVKLPGL